MSTQNVSNALATTAPHSLWSWPPWALLWAFCALLGGCYSPDVGKTMYLCEDAVGNCPDGTSCVNGVCVVPGQALDGSSSGDMQTPDMAPTGGCTKPGGTYIGFLGADTWACPGKGSLPTLCAVGYSGCKNGIPVDTAACYKLPGFFLADIVGQRDLSNPDPNLASCKAPKPSEGVLWFGCGANTALPSVARFMRGPSCSSLSGPVDCVVSQVIPCFAVTSFAALVSNQAHHGAICCKNP